MAYPTYTYNQILGRVMDRIPNSLDKREGSIIFDAVAPVCYELALAFQELASFNDRAYVDTATGDDLERRCAERGVVRNRATAAVRLGTFNITVPLGSRFRINEVIYVVTENLPANQSKLTCEQAGVVGNIYSGTLIPITYIMGLTLSTLGDILIPGEDEETDELLRLRYTSLLTGAAFGGNISDYEERTKALSGVGGVKVYPVWAGGGTVKLLITDSAYGVPNSTILAEVQEAVDPTINAGLGYGFAPIGHVVTVAPVVGVTINIAFSLTFNVGYIWADVQPYILAALQAYLLSLRIDWDDKDTLTGLVVRISYIESAILGIDGVLDISGTTINGLASNLLLDPAAIPLLGTVVNS